jgi:hypothetical protein
MGDSDMEIRERIFYLASHGPFVVFPFLTFLSILKEKMRISVLCFYYLAQKLHSLQCNVLLMSALNCVDILLLAVV